ncbi:MAG TPA: hypothetical protein VF092_23335 [Longimicrobium sp.]
MRKIRLDMDDLQVVSFTTQKAENKEGTVHAHAQTEWNTCQGGTCDPGDTCWDSCDGVCGTYFCAPTEGSSCQQVSCVIWSCRC